MNIKLIALFLISFFSLNVHANNLNTYPEIEKVLDKYIEEHNIPAISIALVNEGETFYINRGVYNRKDKRKVDEHSNYQIASLSKMFTAIIICNLIEESKLKLNDPIVNFLPKNYSPKINQKLKSITLRDVLHHRSGIARDSKTLLKNKKGNDAFNYSYTEKDFEVDFKKIKINKNTGTSYSYSNFGYAILGYIAERASNKSFDDLLEEYILEPYNLKATTIKFEQVKELVTPYRKEDRFVETAPWLMGKLAPPSGIYSTTTDLAALISLQLEAYRTNPKNLLVLTQDTRPAWKETTIEYGYGFFDWGNNTYGHGGDMDGFSSAYSIKPEDNKGFAILTSSGGKYLPYLEAEIRKHFYAKE